MCLHRAESGDSFRETKLLKFMRLLAPSSCALRYSRLPVEELVGAEVFRPPPLCSSPPAACCFPESPLR